MPIQKDEISRRKVEQFEENVRCLGLEKILRITSRFVPPDNIEEYAKTPYILSNETRKYILIDENGEKTEKDFYYHYIRQNGFAQRYDRLENLMTFKKGKILQADCNLIDSKTMWEVAVKKLKEDVYYFTDKL